MLALKLRVGASVLLHVWSYDIYDVLNTTSYTFLMIFFFLIRNICVYSPSPRYGRKVSLLNLVNGWTAGKQEEKELRDGTGVSHSLV